MLVFSVGVRPRDELSTTAGLAVTQRPGGFIVDTQLRTNLPNIYAIGECANFLGQAYGLIAPGVEMADILAFNFTEGPHHNLRHLQVPDLSTKLKLMGVDVASFGDYFADRGMISKPIPGTIPRAARANGASQGQPTLSPDEIKAMVNAVTYRDPFSSIYKKYIFTTDGKYLLGGMMVGDVKDYVKLVAICRKGSPMEKPLLNSFSEPKQMARRKEMIFQTMPRSAVATMSPRAPSPNALRMARGPLARSRQAPSAEPVVEAACHLQLASLTVPSWRLVLRFPTTSARISPIPARTYIRSLNSENSRISLP
uniref:FAD/NAD(P)-binding domain-containing protein n=1 Tax=Bionectria ochroleuca TaxID=29856 RepID=A0A8H7K6E2_BIOOC